MNKNSIVIVWAALSVVAANAASNVEYSRPRYDVIVERSPFGADPLSIAQQQESQKNVAATKAAEKELRLCFLLESESGEVRAGFQNKAAKAGDPKSVMLMVGESFRGMKLLSIDLLNSQATLDRNGSKVIFELSKPTASKAAPKKTPSVPQRRFGSGFRKTTTKTTQTQQPQLTPEEQAAKRAEVQEQMRQYQMEVLRAGQPPLPVQLTPEMDAQLVEEGVLPPME